MNEQMRKEFEVFFSDKYPLTFSAAKAGEPKAHGDMSIAWWGWQASRETLVIELPKRVGLDRMCSDMTIQEIREANRFNRAIDLAAKAIHATGAKTR